MNYIENIGERRIAEVDALSIEAGTALSIMVNGEAVLTASSTLADLVVERGLAGTRVATARNGEFVPERARATTVLATGDRIEIVSPRHGG